MTEGVRGRGSGEPQGAGSRHSSRVLERSNGWARRSFRARRRECSANWLMTSTPGVRRSSIPRSRACGALRLRRGGASPRRSRAARIAGPDAGPGAAAARPIRPRAMGWPGRSSVVHIRPHRPARRDPGAAAEGPERRARPPAPARPARTGQATPSDARSAAALRPRSPGVRRPQTDAAPRAARDGDRPDVAMRIAGARTSPQRCPSFGAVSLAVRAHRPLPRSSARASRARSTASRPNASENSAAVVPRPAHAPAKCLELDRSRRSFRAGSELATLEWVSLLRPPPAPRTDRERPAEAEARCRSRFDKRPRGRVDPNEIASQKAGVSGCPLFGKCDPLRSGGVFDRRCVGPLDGALMTPRVGHAVRKAGPISALKSGRRSSPRVRMSLP